MSYQARSYLSSGDNNLKILEYVCGDIHFGINILKSGRVLPVPAAFTKVAGAHPAVLGLVNDLGINLPVIDLKQFLQLRRGSAEDHTLRRRIIVTEFFGQHNSFIVDRVERIGDFSWQDVQDAHELMRNLNGPFVLGIINREAQPPILLLDYERIILDLNPDAVNLSVPTQTTIIEAVDRQEAQHSLRQRANRLQTLQQSVSPTALPLPPPAIERASAVTLGAREGAPTSEPAGDLPQATSLSEAPPLGPPTILVAEDSLTVRNLVVQLLREHEYNVLEAADGVIAKRLFDEHPEIVLVLTDVEMPQMDGLSLVQEIRKIDENVPIILHSSIGDMGMKERARSVRANSHITKFNIDELLRAVRELMQVYEE